MSAELLARVQADAVAALKAGDKARVAVLRMVASDLKRAAIDAGVDVVAGDAALAVLRRAVRTRADAAEQFEKGGRPELAAKERAEIAAIEAYLPKAPSKADVEAAARAVIAEKGLAGPQAAGAAIKETLARLGPGADGKTVARVVGGLLRR